MMPLLDTSGALLQARHVAPWAVASAVVIGLLIGWLVFLVGRRLLRCRWAYAERPPPLPARSPAAERFTCRDAVEQRRSLRRLGHPVKVLLAGEGEAGTVLEGWVLDRSMTGLCLALPGPVAEGVVLRVRAGNAPEGTPWVEAEVVHCQPEADYCRVGCRYPAAPCPGVLLLFG